MAKNLKEKLIIFLLFLIPVLFFIFSFFWIDYGLFLMLANSHPFFNHFQWLVSYRDAHRVLLANVYLLLIVILFAIQMFLLFIKKIKFLSIKKLWLVSLFSTLLFSFSYPFLSKDLFSYLFSAKMIWTCLLYTSPSPRD